MIDAFLADFIALSPTAAIKKFLKTWFFTNFKGILIF